MNAAEFFVAVYDLRDLQKQVAEDQQNGDSSPDAQDRSKRCAELEAAVDAELHKCDNKQQKTYYLLAKEKINRLQAMGVLKEQLGLERI